MALIFPPAWCLFQLHCPKIYISFFYVSPNIFILFLIFQNDAKNLEIPDDENYKKVSVNFAPHEKFYSYNFSRFNYNRYFSNTVSVDGFVTTFNTKNHIRKSSTVQKTNGFIGFFLSIKHFTEILLEEQMNSCSPK